MESTGLSADVEKWLASGTDVRRLAVPAQTLTVPGLGPLLVLAVVGWPDSITILTVEPGLGAKTKHSIVGLGLPCAYVACRPSDTDMKPPGSFDRGGSVVSAAPVPAGSDAVRLRNDGGVRLRT
jgi:hypothetical protein